jgi:hypothetical protein
VTSVENGRKFQNSKRGEATMPDGPAIFETSGAWEDLSTPSRDLRLLIAIDVILRFPDRVARRPERYAMPRDKNVAEVKAELQRVLASELATRKFSYPRSDGSAWMLTLNNVIDRAVDLEMAYNPNDCRAALWRAGQERRGFDLQALRAGSAPRENEQIPHLVPRAAPATAGVSGRVPPRQRRPMWRQPRRIITITLCACQNPGRFQSPQIDAAHLRVGAMDARVLRDWLRSSAGVLGCFGGYIVILGLAIFITQMRT